MQRFRGRYFLYARANLKREGGGRFVQVTSAASPDGPWAPFRLISFRSEYDWCKASKNNVYSAAVKTNPADESTLLGMFPFTGPGTGLNSGERPRRWYAHIALAVSCDGVRFSEPLPVIKVPKDWWGRPNDLPVDGYVQRGDTVYLFVHENMPFTYDWPHATGRHSRIKRHAVPLEKLRQWTSEMKAKMPSCTHVALGLPFSNFSNFSGEWLGDSWYDAYCCCCCED